ncbi:HIT family protein [Kitasatospora purpeofusca]|uniref:hypothetical protein n=1 Tax=Kitasatospora purpeofusca TaxID=67352 RepID=UPI00364856CE
MFLRDPDTGARTIVATGRTRRLAAASGRCPLCRGGLEAPDPYVTPYAFANRWPALPAGHCLLVAYSGEHTADLAELSLPAVAAVVDVWADRSRALAETDGVEYALVFENRGRGAGATLDHPHSQIFGLPVVPDRVGLCAAGACGRCSPADRALVVEEGSSWSVSVPTAPRSAFSLRIAARRHTAALSDLTAAERRELADLVQRSVRRLDAVFDGPMPYHLWIEQGPPGGAVGHVTVFMAGLGVAKGTTRILGAAEVATGLHFVPEAPADVARRLRTARGADTMSDLKEKHA